MDWVDVKKRLPAHRTKVLFVYDKNVYKGVFLEKHIDAHCDSNETFISDDGGFYRLEWPKITHWMPLPNLPQYAQQ